MSTLALNPVSSWWWRAGWIALTTICIVFAIRTGVTVNIALVFIFTSLVLLIAMHDRANGLMSALVFFMVKPVFVRMAYAIDKGAGGSGGFDLLGITPALLLSGMIILQLYFYFSQGNRITLGRTRLYLVIFTVIAILAIFNPANSVLVGFAGFERNVLPNMLVLATASFVLTSREHLRKYTKVLIMLGLISCIYGIGQYFLGLYPWEKNWVVEVAFANSTDGWLTVGLKGVEFRLFSIFFNYMDFTFCNALIFALAISIGTTLKGKWNKVRILYIISWAVVLILSLERTPLMMSIIAAGLIFYLKSNKAKRKRIVWKSLTAVTVFILALSIASPYLKDTGAQKLIRLAELTNPLAASSIADRLQKNWGPAFGTIVSNPLGVGMGFGSQTRANVIATKSNFYIEPHNELLQKALETGIVGGVMFLLVLISVYRDSLKLSAVSNSARRLGIGFAGATIGFWLCGMVNVPFSGSSGLLYWASAGLVLGQFERTKSSKHAVNKTHQTADTSRS